MKSLTLTQLRDLRARGAEHVLIDVLPEESYREHHIPDAINVPLEYDSFLQRVEHIVDDKERTPVVVYCADADCNASPAAAEKLEEAGFENVYDFEGGLEAWEREGFPLEGARS